MVRRSPPTLLPALALALCCAGSAGCVATLERAPGDRAVTASLPPDVDSALGVVFGESSAGAPSRFAPVDRGDEGLDLRLGLAAAAETSLDVQSYLWHEDSCGGLLLDRLLEAADRGVRVRLLIDGFQLEGHEDLDAALGLHPNFALRVFNPTVHRGGLWRAVELAENLGRLDHRMHNKLFLADGVAGVFGGRNVGGEYFGLGDEADFRDFDLLASGPVLADLAVSFDEFWNGPWTVPIDRLVHDAGGEAWRKTHARARASLRATHADDDRLDARRALEADDWLAALERAQARMVGGRAQVLHDSAAIDRDGAGGILAQAFEAALASERGDVLLVTAYLVPDDALLEIVRAHTAAGERVQILTNSYVSTNQPLVHTYYAATREALLDAGAELHELRGDAWSHVHHRSPGSRARKLGLHAKSGVFGDSHVMVGSLNLDPRSMVLNTELGVLIESRELAERVRACLERELSASNAWRVERAPTGGLLWRTQGLELDREPAMGAGERAREWFLRLLPFGGEV